MKKIIGFFLSILFLPALGFGQVSNPVFLKSHVLSGPAEVEIHLPQGFLSAPLTPLYDTTLGTRIVNAMQAAYLHDRLNARHGIAISVLIPGRPQWSTAIGLNDDTNPMDTNLAFEIASNTKTFVTSLIMKLQDQGKLSIKDSIGKWLLKKYPNIDGAITIEELLNHSSGIYDYLNDDPNLTALEDFYAVNPEKRWTPDSILFTYVGPPNFKPGTSYSYSNTNFVLAGLIAERVGGAKLGTQIHANFLDPLKMTHTFFGGDDSITIKFAHNWTPPGDTINPEIDYYGLDKTAQLTGSWGAGNMVSTPSDLVHWVNALYTGKIVSAASLKQMMTVHHWPNGEYYGLGTERAPYYTKLFYGHSGSLIGFKSAMYTNPADSVSIMLYMNSDAIVKDVSVNDYLVAVLNEIYRAPAEVASDASPASVSVETYPNPSTDHVTFYFHTEKEGMVKLRVTNELGMEVRQVINEPLSSGAHSASMDLSQLARGTYFYSLQSATGVTAGKIIVQ